MEKTEYAKRVEQVMLLRLGGAPASSCVTWIKAISRTEQDGTPCPTWAELERLAPSVVR